MGHVGPAVAGIIAAMITPYQRDSVPGRQLWNRQLWAKNLARFGVLEDVTLINGRSFEETRIRDQVDELVSAGRLVPFGYYGWGTWIGQWQRK